VGVARDQGDAREATGDETAQEGRPAGPVLARHEVEAERLTHAVCGDAHGVHAGHGRDPAGLAHLDVQGVELQVRVGARKGPAAEGLDDFVEGGREAADLAPGDALDAERAHELVDPAR
jgi:hypothetical protein